jgi:phosphoribosylformylglycinamidine cyclo-ligase
MNYKDSGVDVTKADMILNHLKADFKDSEQRSNMSNNYGLQILNSYGDYCSYIDISYIKTFYDYPVLTFSTDGVGSKLLLVEKFPEIESNIAEDLFAMVFNDIICSGSKPLYMLDYYATHSLHEKFNGVNRCENFLQNLVTTCKRYNVGLIGGELAEVPALYDENKYDLAGFGVGIVDKFGIIDKRNCRIGDAVIGIKSSGPHSNGYSLINALIETWDLDKNKEFITDCLKPTKIYIDPILDLLKVQVVSGIAHITGGGFNNISRIIPDNLAVEIDLTSWYFPNVFNTIQEYSGMNELEMLNIFNCGIGMVLIVPQQDVSHTIQNIQWYEDFSAIEIGKVIKKDTQSITFYRG